MLNATRSFELPSGLKLSIFHKDFGFAVVNLVDAHERRFTDGFENAVVDCHKESSPYCTENNLAIFFDLLD
jgi:hypothetical protein